MLRILSLTYEYPPIGGGGGVVAAALNEQLAARGDEIRCVTSRMRGQPPQETIRGVEVFRTACIRRRRDFTTALELLTGLWPAYRRAAALVAERRPDIIHAHFALPTGVVAWLLSRRFGVPYVLTAHGSDIPGYNPDRFAGLHKLLGRAWLRIINDAGAVTSPSEYLAGLIRRNGVTRAIDVIPNGYLPTPYARGQKRKLVLVVARLFPRKGVQHFIEALANEKSDWQFVIAGDGPFMPALRAQAELTRSPVEFIGFVDHRRLAEYYADASIFVFPSIRENFPMVLLEAMEAGCAIITTDAEGCAEVVGDAGVVVAAGSSSAVRTELFRLMQDPDRCRELAVRARLRVRAFRWERIALLYRQVLRRVRPESRQVLDDTIEIPPEVDEQLSATGRRAL